MSPADANKENEPTARPVAKRRKTTASTSRKSSGKKKGILKYLPEMPLEILFETFRYLYPLDLLRLARTTKALRRILMHRSAVSLWKSAQANLEGFPEAPPGLSEPAFANLAFDTHCHFCGCLRASKLIWMCKVRSCNRCLEARIIDYTDLIYVPKYYTRLPTEESWSPRHLLPVFEFKRKNRRYENNVCFREDAEALCAAFDLVKHDALAYERLTGVFLKRMVDRYNHLEKCLRWECISFNARGAELDKIQDQRRKDIFLRLAAAGWDEELKYLQPSDKEVLENHPFVAQCKKLTDRAWKDWAPIMNAEMAEIKIRRLAAERAVVIDARRKMFARAVKKFAKANPTNEFSPNVADLYFMDEVAHVRVIIEDTPPTTEVTPGELDTFVDTLPELYLQWRTSMKQKLLAIVKQHQKVFLGNESDDSVDLVIGLLRCEICGMNFPFSLAQDHTRPDTTPDI
ncbi:hypothetical protein HGRIS_012809 [Hohenbuehelia grisea]|uniref:F-box domain-containing protein n=1 Tax=Hohenbuehelia grisea TaxID=104357 RepID=A0ABR3ITJ6_9AGAR